VREIHSAIRRAALRLALMRLLRASVICLTLAAVALGAALLGERLLGLSVDWRASLGTALAVAVLAALIWTIVRRPDAMTVARLLDERAGTRDALSTALAVSNQPDGWSERARVWARDAATKIRSAQAVPIRAPRLWPAPLVATALLGAMWLFMPQVDLFGVRAEAKQEAAKAEELRAVQVELAKQEEELKTLFEAIDAPELTEQLTETATPKTAEEAKREAIKRLTTLKDRLEALRQGEKGLAAKSLEESMKRLRRPGEGPLDEMAKKLQAGDFEGARQEMEKLADKLNSGELTEEQREQLRKQMEDLAKQLAELEKMNQALKDQLAKLGLDPALADDPEALQQALEQMQGLSQEQIRQMMQQAQSAQQSQEMIDALSQSLQTAAQNMQGSMNRADALRMCSNCLGGMEAMQNELSAMQAAQGQLDQQLQALGQNPQLSGAQAFKQWAANSAGGRLGGIKPGVGTAWNQVDPVESPVTRQKEMSKSKQTGGPIIATRLVQGSQVRGESRAQFAEVVEAAEESAAEAIENQRIPRERREAVKRYFGTLQEKAAEEKSEGEEKESGDGAGG